LNWFGLVLKITATPNLGPNHSQVLLGSGSNHGSEPNVTIPIKHVHTMASWHMIDFIEVSGGNDETPGKFIEFGRTYVEPSADSFFLAEFMSLNPLSKSPR
jgi:hypothetical protein